MLEGLVKNRIDYSDLTRWTEMGCREDDSLVTSLTVITLDLHLQTGGS